MERYRFEAMFHATDGSGGRYFCESRFKARGFPEAVLQAERQLVELPGMTLVMARLFTASDGMIWSRQSELSSKTQSDEQPPRPA